MKREKHRYILVESSSKISDRENFQRALNKEILSIVGQLNYHKINPRVVEFIDDRQFVLRVFLSGYEDTILALSLIKTLEGLRIGFYTLRSSGTIKALKTHLEEYM